MKLIIGLGNPESRFTGTRHNVGYSAVEQFATDQGGAFKNTAKFKAHVAELSVDSTKVIIARPTTYYNVSGESVRLLADFYKIEPRDILIVHDEMMLPIGTLRARQGGGDAGNNGIKSITSHMGPDTARLRVGIWSELRDQIDDADYVLGKFTADERAILARLQPVIDQQIIKFITGDLAVTTHKDQ